MHTQYSRDTSFVPGRRSTTVVLHFLLHIKYRHLIYLVKMESMPEDHDPQEPTRDLFSIRIHNILTEAHNAHGLRHSDFHQYRTYCTNRLSRLRHHKPVQKELSFSATGYKASSHDRPPIKGGRHAFHPRGPLDETTLSSHVNFTLVHLYESERAWAHAMELKGMYDTLKVQTGSMNHKSTGTKDGQQAAVSLHRSTASPGSIRRHYIQRLKKACKNVGPLEHCASVACDERTRAECMAYGYWIRGNYFFEVGQWESACKHLGRALLLCKAMASDITSMENPMVDLEDRDLFTTRADTVIQPLIRYAQYEFQQETKMTSQEASKMMLNVQQELINHELVSENSFLVKCFDFVRSVVPNEATTPTDQEGVDVNYIHFRGLKIKVDNKSLRMMLWKLNDRKKDLVSIGHGIMDEDAVYVDLLTCYDDAISLISEDLKGLINMASGPSVNTKKAEAQGLLGFIKYERLKLLMMRTENMIHELESKIDGNQTPDPDMESKVLEEISHLHDTLLQDAKAIVDLPGGVTTSSDKSGIPVEDEFILQAKANVLRIRALRCYYIGRLYGTHKLGKYGEALTLFDRSSKLAAQAAEEIAACSDMERADQYIQYLMDLEIDLTKAKCQARVAALLSRNGGGRSPSVPRQSFLRRLDDFESCVSSLQDDSALPPLEPIICKPSFFDVAGTYVCEYPLDKLQMHIDSSKPPSSRRILGWFRSS